MRRKTAVWLVAVAAAAATGFIQVGCGRGSEAPPAAGGAPQAAAPEAGAPAQPAPAPEAGAPPAKGSPSSSSASAPAAQAPPQAAPEPPPPPPPPPPRTFTLRQGTPIAVFTSSTLSTKANKSGET